MDGEQNLQRLLAQFDQAQEPLDEREVHDQISKLVRSERDAGKTPSLQSIAEWAAFMFWPEYQWREGGWASYYGPMFGGKTDDGRDVYTPDIHEFDAKTFEYWATRAREAKHPILKTRYADLCWDFQKRITRSAPAIDLAYIVIGSTIDSASRRLAKHDVNGKKQLARSLMVALGINDRARMEAVRDAIVAYEDKVARDDAAGLWGFSYDLIVEDKRIPKSPELEAKVIQSLEDRLGRLAALRDGKPIDPWGSQYAALRLARYYRRKNKDSEVRRVILVYGGAFERLAEGASGIQATGWLRSVYDHYREFGLTDQAETLLQKVREAAKRSHDEMAVHREKIEVPKEEMEAFLDQLTRGSLSDTLNRVALEFLANRSQAIDQLEKLSKSAPLMSLMSISIVDREGRPTAQLGSLEDDLDGRIVHHISQVMNFAHIFLHMAMERVLEKFRPSPDDILNHLRQSPVFLDDSLSIIRTGLVAYLQGNDLVAAHLLVPQIEAAVRNLLDLCRGNLWKPHRGGGLMLKNLEDVLREDAVQKSLTEDGVLTLRVLLTDQRGWNIRNAICHGLLPSDSYGRGMTNRLVHALLLLALLRPTKSS